METPTAYAHAFRIIVPPVAVILASVAAITLDAFLSIGLYLAGCLIASRISRSWWCPALLVSAPMALLVVAVDHVWPAAKKDGVAAMALMIGSVVYSLAIALGGILGAISTYLVVDRHDGRRRSSAGTVHVGQ